MAVAAVLSSMTMAGSSFKVKHTGTFGTLKKKHTTHGITIFLLSPFGKRIIIGGAGNFGLEPAIRGTPARPLPTSCLVPASPTTAGNIKSDHKKKGE